MYLPGYMSPFSFPFTQISMKLQHTLLERFLRYVKIDTESDPFSTTSPSTEKQKDLSRVLNTELQEMGISNSRMNEHGYVYAEVPGKHVDNSIPGIFFCAHIDTAPDVSGKNVKPILHKNYQGQDIILPDDPNQIIGVSNYPQLKNKVGHDIISASGTTLLGSDDKSGVAIIMDAAHQLMNTASDIKRGPVCLLFTTDEEVGHGVEHVNADEINAQFGYTLDGADIGDYADENFSADGLTVVIHGISTHTGYAKGKMIHSMKIAAAFLNSLPTDTLAPEVTSGHEGFIHPSHIEGNLEKTTIKFLIRDFNTDKLDEYVSFIEKKLQDVIKNYEGASYECIREKQYRNMKEVIAKNPLINEIAYAAMRKAGIEPKPNAIRGGTDGALLSRMGLPCPNLFAGEQGIHSRTEWTSVQDMEKAVETIIHIIDLNARHYLDQSS